MLPKINQLLYIQVATSDETEAAIEYKTRIADETEGELYIEIPVREGTSRYKRLYLGDELSAYYLSSEGVKHYFNSHVLGFKEDVVRLVRIRKPELESITKIQRRNFLRVGAELEMAVQFSGLRFIVITDDVGGGGVSFLSDGKRPIQEGQEMECWLLLNFRNGSIDHAQYKAEVVRMKKLETGRVQVMCKFIAISENERQKIIRYCFERQFELRK
ncbi:c-di-GMP-binding flagellar brake protein YcgR [Paenibacillus phyllosphaerae]|uniref:C-di-GMP-binding flagellar brake protein YcgR n=1 Tax=Paenibacillus phyllosphaerae TaxID=274593 RepID=A0A7W5FLN1_9BACL|nr:flagellar brake domain-containing protein [Paenibacillus phyllosphaerae]MBB3109258.1 c-di-GMP-binding flagellar brake protein YcgR [Paenibacillus phyllosphaerae]